MNFFKKWWENQSERHRKYKNKEDEDFFTKCPNCRSMKGVEKKVNYSWIVFFIGLIIIGLTLIVWNAFMFFVGLIISGYQSMKMLNSSINGDKHICNECNHEWIGKGYGKNHKVVS